MQWTKERPKHIGYYWLLYTDAKGTEFEDRIMIMVQVNSADLLVYTFHAAKPSHMEQFADAEWYGPLMPPDYNCSFLF